MLYEMLSGRRPFEQSRPDDLLHAHVREEPPSFADRGITHVPPALEAVVRGCLAKHPDERPRDAAELLQRYEDALGKRLSVPRRGGSGAFVRPRCPRRLPPARRRVYQARRCLPSIVTRCARTSRPTCPKRWPCSNSKAFCTIWAAT